MGYLSKPEFGQVPAYLQARCVEAESKAETMAAAEAAQAALQCPNRSLLVGFDHVSGI